MAYLVKLIIRVGMTLGWRLRSLATDRKQEVYILTVQL